MLGTTVMIPTLLVPLMGGTDVRLLLLTHIPVNHLVCKYRFHQADANTSPMLSVFL